MRHVNLWVVAKLLVLPAVLAWLAVESLGVRRDAVFVLFVIFALVQGQIQRLADERDAVREELSRLRKDIGSLTASLSRDLPGS